MYEVQIANKQVGFSHCNRRKEHTILWFSHSLMWLLVEGLNFVTGTDSPQSHHCSESMTSSVVDMPIPKSGRKELGGVLFH